MMTSSNRPLYVDMGELFASGLVEPPAPTVGLRNDGVAFFYPRCVNSVWGAPETGKTLIVCCCGADIIFSGGSFVFIDLDHNGPHAIASRLRALGVSVDVLCDDSRFRYYAPDDAPTLRAVVEELANTSFTLIVLDSVGEMTTMLGADSNSDDDYRKAHAAVSLRLADTGAAVVTIDHINKTSQGTQTGTSAKRQVIDGSSLRVNLVREFVPGAGGKAELIIDKDRHGGLRSRSAGDGKKQVAAIFEMHHGEVANWTFHAPSAVASSLDRERNRERDDVAALMKLDPAPTKVADVKSLMSWGSDRATVAFRGFKELTASLDSVPPRSLSKERGTGGIATDIPQESSGTVEEQERQSESWREQPRNLTAVNPMALGEVS